MKNTNGLDKGVNRMAYKMVFSDMDGTLLNSQHQITPATVQSIQRIMQKGIPFIPVSARPPYAILPYMEQLHNENEIICYSGALILDKNLTALYSITLENTLLPQLAQILAHYPTLSVSYYSHLDWFTTDLDSHWIKQESEITGLTAKEKPQYLSNVHKILLMGEATQIEQIEPLLKQQFPQLSIHRSKKEYLEIMNKAATKANAIQFMAQRAAVDKADIIAFGDNFNDLDMLEYVGLGIAMGNSPEEIKRIAKQITVSNDKDGIAFSLNKLF
ncbi:Cof-type HAD-IIB family hydrolase [Avibacterium paragallinarum]|uniref:Cof-type HAD-IIB family hydrolase n=1 Tax=Avibacterium paragallinarum TaxID=728 RepID=UPI0021F7E8CE|nr:Cof-type HAD-IIB family hydrolase [Avibacterium paragallinarum]UXN36365.1 Cof-type HAD-IIB family hydrolase [Avibacterium paragallinarum]